MDADRWWKEGVIYQIYPRSFADGNGDGFGDLPGIIEKLDVLQELGIDGIWISPFFPTPDVDLGYDITDYCNVDPRMGTMADYDRLVEAAHRRGIHVIVDLVLNHTSDRHPWFIQSRSSRDNPYHDWYLWRDPKPGKKRPNNWASIFGGHGWEYDEHLDQYYFHMFYKEQPDLNWRNPAVVDEVRKIMRFWLDHGTDGFRLDVFGAYFKDAMFRDNPTKLGLRYFDRQEHIYDADQPEMMPWLREMRAIMDEKPGRYLVGETFFPNPEKAARYCGPGLLHGTFNFELSNTPWSASKFAKAIQRWETVLAKNAWPTNFLSNHDQARAADRLAHGEDDERLKVAAAMLLTLRGTPYIYYGEEIGMRGPRIKRADIIDPLSKKYWPFYPARDKARSVAQWSGQEYAGFSPVKPAYPLHPNFTKRNVEAQRADPNSLFNFYKKLIHIRKELPALRQGKYQPVSDDPRVILAYLRQTEDQTVLVVLNMGGKPPPFFLGGALTGMKWEFVLSNKRTTLPVLSNQTILLEGEEALILKAV